MSIKPDPIKTLIEKHIELFDNLYLLRTTIGRLMKKISPQLLEVLTRDSLSFLKSMEQNIRCEEEVLFLVLKSALGNKNGPIVSMAGDHANLKEEMERLRTVITYLETENTEECNKAINLTDALIDSLIDLFSRHINKEERCLYRAADEVLHQKELVEIEKKMKEMEIVKRSFFRIFKIGGNVCRIKDLNRQKRRPGVKEFAGRCIRISQIRVTC